MANKPIFQAIFAEHWRALPPVMLKHYANRPYSDDVATVRGVMEVQLSPFMKLMAPLLAMTKTLIPKSGKNIDVTVHFRSEPDTDVFCFDRRFKFSDDKEYRFYSRMQPVGRNEVIEWTKSGIGWHAAYTYENERVILSHKGYYLKLPGTRLPLPTWLFGKAHAYEEAVDENRFQMMMQIVHPLFGELYRYSGMFEAVNE